MLRRTASTLNGHAAAWLRLHRLPRRLLTPPPAQLGSHQQQAQQLQPRRGLPHPGGAQGYARMARRLPPARPDGYSTSEGGAEDPDAREFEEFPDTEPAGAGEDGDDAEDSEVEGFMMDFADLFSDDGEEDEEEGADDEGGK